MLLLNAQTIWMTFMMILMSIIKKEKVLIVFDNMISQVMSNKKAQQF